MFCRHTDLEKGKRNDTKPSLEQYGVAMKRRRAPLALMIDQFGYLGGGQIVLMEVVSALLGSGIRLKLIAPKGGELERQLSNRFDGKVEMLDQSPSKLSTSKKTVLDVFRLVLESVGFARRWKSHAKSATVIYANGGRWFLGAAMLSRLSGNPLVLHLHLQFSSIEKVLVTLCVLIGRRPIVVANSDYTAQSAGKFLSIWKKLARVEVVENCLPSKYEALEYRPRLEDFQTVIECVVVGLLCPEKGQDIVINALKDVPGVKIHLVGRIGASREEWAAQLLENLPVNVVYHGETCDIPGVIKKENIYVNIVPSRWEEPFGLVAIEGMANSCLTIVSKRGALPMIAKRTGAFVFDGTEQGLRETLLELFGRDRDWLEQTRRSQYEKTKLEYSTARFQRELHSIFSVLG